ncbi:tRNA dimethylallyltransferase, mitochondrial [Friedmanniomyces endolithicus]|nr:tRNA dimethylallyltransferase, mitochondrial [Friedmanniomyces endolithicus]KAK0823369.1 tRNA dimethylallyltransferase, mitochondrial [Friedmanniomyces endolithicus]
MTVICEQCDRTFSVEHTLSSMTRKPPREPLIAIIGATGTGKSQVYYIPSPFYMYLAVELATRFNGEIINGDI